MPANAFLQPHTGDSTWACGGTRSLRFNRLGMLFIEERLFSALSSHRSTPLGRLHPTTSIHRHPRPLQPRWQNPLGAVAHDPARFHSRRGKILLKLTQPLPMKGRNMGWKLMRSAPRGEPQATVPDDLSREDFDFIRRLVSERSGIHLGPDKRPLVVHRLLNAPSRAGAVQDPENWHIAPPKRGPSAARASIRGDLHAAFWRTIQKFTRVPHLGPGTHLPCLCESLASTTAKPSESS